MLVLYDWYSRLRPCRIALMTAVLLSLPMHGLGAAAPLTPTAEQTRWIEAQGNKVFTIGFDAYRNIHYQTFDFDNQAQALIALRAGVVDGFVSG